MSDQEWIDLGRRAVACRAWRWMPGMLGVDPGGYAGRRVEGSAWVDEVGDRLRAPKMIATLTPDFRDPATLGCLLALVREAWGLPALAVVCSDGRWRVHNPALDVRFPIRAPIRTNTEARALVAALESAPEPTR